MEYGEEDARERNGKAAQGAKREHGAVTDENGGDFGIETPTVENLRKYADYFDVSMDYIFARTDNPEGKLYAHQPKALAGNREMRQFIELCFDPSSPYNERLKETMLRMLEEMQE